MSMVQGGPGLPETVLNYFSQGAVTRVQIDLADVPLYLKFLLNKYILITICKMKRAMFYHLCISLNSSLQKHKLVKAIFVNEENPSLLLETGYDKPLN